MRGAELDRLDQRREAVRVLREAKISGYVRGTARARLVPSNDRELVGQRSELGLPDAASSPAPCTNATGGPSPTRSYAISSPPIRTTFTGRAKHASESVFPRMHGKIETPAFAGVSVAGL